MKLKIFAILFLLLYSCGLHAQFEELSPLTGESYELKSQSKSLSSLKTLPFFDDFAYPYAKPISSLWEDGDVYVNSSFAKNLVTIGVASFDAMDSNGKLHENVSTTPRVSDFLTSLPINLKNYELVFASDKLYKKDGSSFTLLDDSYYLYDENTGSYVTVTQGVAYYAGDTLFKKQDEAYVACQDSIFDESKNYISGSYNCEHIWNEYQLEDSLALSFYYQSGGYVDSPDVNDSLVLEYYVPYDTTGIFINEISNFGVEIYNATDSVLSLNGYFLLFDTLSNIAKDSLKNFKLSDVVVSSFQHCVISPSIFGIDTLKKAYAFLYSPDMTLVDYINLGDKLTSEMSYARMTDGNPTWSFTSTVTLGECNPSWKWIWATTEKTNDTFVPVYLPLDLPSYLVKGFRFRFKNYVSLSNDKSHARNEDFWHLDVIWLNSNRSSEKRNVPDVAFASEVSALYSKYKAVPMSHFVNVEEKDFRMTILAKFSNFDVDYRKIKFNFSVEKLHTGDKLAFATYETDIPAEFTVSESDVLADFIDDDVVPQFIMEDATAYKEGVYEFLYYFIDKNNPLYSQYRWNDTCRSKLTLSNYYAYDDGTPEAGYGLRDAPMGRVAFKYDILQSDTLKAISTYFNPTLNETPTTFNLCVWANDGGKPGELLYYSPGERVKYVDGMFQFVDYEINPANIVSGSEALVVGKTFFIGWEQPNDVLLNMGIDMNATLNNRLFYNLGFEWENSVQKGALLLRPIFDFYEPKTDVENIESNDVTVYPTIAESQVSVISEDEIAMISVYDLSGNCMLRTTNTNFSVQSFSDGVYVVYVLTAAGQTKVCKFVVAK